MNYLHLFMVFFFFSFIDALWCITPLMQWGEIYTAASLYLCLCSNAPPDETRRANNKAHHKWSTVSLVDKLYMVTRKQLLSLYSHSMFSARCITWQWENNATAKQQKMTTTWIGSCSALNSFFLWISSHFVAVSPQHQCFGSLSMLPKCCFQLQQAAAIIKTPYIPQNSALFSSFT